MKKRNMVVGPVLTPDWPRKVGRVFSELFRQLCLGLENPGKGLTVDQLQLVTEHRNPFARAVQVVGDSLSRAKEIMGKNFLGAEEAIRFLKANQAEEEVMKKLTEIPFSEATLQECKNTHVLVLDLGLSILDIRGRVDRKLFCSHEDARYNNQAFAKLIETPQWRLIRRDAIPDSFNKNWGEQLVLLAKNEEVPEARQIAYLAILYYLAKGERLFEHFYVRTKSITSAGARVRAGLFDAFGFFFSGWWSAGRGDRIGLSSSRKS